MDSPAASADTICVRGEYSRMRLRSAVVLCAAILFAMPALTAAQNREPHAGTFAIGGDAGTYVPGTEFHAGFRPDALLEFYITGRLSIRGMGAWASNGADNEIDSLRQVQGTLNVTWNWEAEYWHPFVTAGVGAYMLQARASGVDVGSMRTHAGGNFGVGIEYFARPKVTFKFETTYHWVQQGDFFASPSGLAATVGMKKYF
jgi:hypothetical protein